MFGYPSCARTTMATDPEYNPMKHGHITLAPDPSVSGAGTSKQKFMNANGVTSDQPPASGVFTFSFPVPSMPRISNYIPGNIFTGQPPGAEAARYANIEKEYEGSTAFGAMDMAASAVSRVKRKPFTHDLNPNTWTAPKAMDEVENRNKKRRIRRTETHNYILASDPTSLIDSDTNTNANAYEQTRRPKKYAFGASKIRRGYSMLKASVANKWNSLFVAPQTPVEPNELSFEEETLMIETPAPPDFHMGDA